MVVEALIHQSGNWKTENSKGMCDCIIEILLPCVEHAAETYAADISAVQAAEFHGRQPVTKGGA
jgi:hypothetical protein